MPPSFNFQPGRFSPVVEIVSPDACSDFYDNLVGTEFAEPTFNNTGNKRSILISSDVPNCLDSAQLDSPIPHVRPDKDLLFSSGSIVALPAYQIYGCTCLLDSFRVLTLPDSPEVVRQLAIHDCDSCPVCTSTNSPWYNNRLWISAFGSSRGSQLQVCGSDYPAHPSFPGLRFLAPFGLPNPWIDKYIDREATTRTLTFPTLSYEWLHRRRRHYDRSQHVHIPENSRAD
nr:hypothetical protein [Colletotrichum associated partitivirus 1]